ncbi:hypothetical protein GQ55_1G092300 [Panicum hallii var. hallii]|uniref:Gelsolin-like domain-containing protein n=1 Tax=Panicum hallii var. hallii TaxID=1504633 RepID=A0A2T7F3Y7_9POAL|nr:hypothetical protein GQ55_1G092300 [Panicum hallii var. hallii]
MPTHAGYGMLRANQPASDRASHAPRARVGWFRFSPRGGFSPTHHLVSPFRFTIAVDRRLESCSPSSVPSSAWSLRSRHRQPQIEKLQAVPVPKESYGKFFTGDWYIILKITALKNGSFRHDIHYWLGKDTCQDEAGTPAIKTVELDAALGGRAVQYHEVQGNETEKFLSYFKSCICDSSCACKLDIYIVSVKYVFVSIKLMCVGVKLLKI